MTMAVVVYDGAWITEISARAVERDSINVDVDDCANSAFNQQIA